MKEEPTKKQMRRFYIAFILCFTILMFQAASGSACEPIPTVEMGDGAGTDWSCSNCGSSNKQWEMSCSNCGKWR